MRVARSPTSEGEVRAGRCCAQAIAGRAERGSGKHGAGDGDDRDKKEEEEEEVRCGDHAGEFARSLPSIFRMAWLERRLRALEYPSAQGFSLGSTSPLLVSPVLSLASLSIIEAPDAGVSLRVRSFTNATNATKRNSDAHITVLARCVLLPVCDASKSSPFSLKTGGQLSSSAFSCISTQNHNLRTDCWEHHRAPRLDHVYHPSRSFFVVYFVLNLAVST